MSRIERLATKRRWRRRSFAGFVGLLLIATGAATSWRLGVLGGDEGNGAQEADSSLFDPDPVPGPTSPPAPAPPAAPEPINADFEGLTTFRGNASRTYHGEGPIPTDPRIRWRYPATGGLCSQSSDRGETKVWCGNGWTGQPNVVEREDGKTEVRFGAYDRAVHVVNGKTGKPLYEPFVTGDIIKGTVTSDPDGFPLVYTGSRDSFFRVLALDRGRQPVELWRLGADSAPNPMWNDDWDSSALVIDDHLLVGGENSWFYVVKLNREFKEDGKVAVDPKVRATIPGFDDELLRDLGDQEVSIENSVAYRDGVVYFANSGGLVQGWDIGEVLAGGEDFERVFRFWTGEDTDASVVIDDEGFLYVASELERSTARGQNVGQLMKLDPNRPDDPLVWGRPIPGNPGGIWATPALYKQGLFVGTNTGRLLGVHRGTGRIRWEIGLEGKLWSSPAIVDGALVVGDCGGNLRAYRLKPPLEEPEELWSVELDGCIEATPAIWKGMVYVGSRGGGIYGIG